MSPAYQQPWARPKRAGSWCAGAWVKCTPMVASKSVLVRQGLTDLLWARCEPLLANGTTRGQNHTYLAGELPEEGGGGSRWIYEIMFAGQLWRRQRRWPASRRWSARSKRAA